MPLSWRRAHFGESFDGYRGRLFVARVVRYGDYDHEAGHVLRGHSWRGFLNGFDQPKVPGPHGCPEDAQEALKQCIR